MNHRKNTGHSVSSLFSLLLFGVFVLFLILMLLFSARIYQQTVKQTDSDSELGTAATYLTTKFRQHDRGDEIFSGSLDDIPALCFRNDIKGKEYITYIYLKNDSLMELFTAKGSPASSDAGTVISQLSDFRFSEMENGFYHFSLESTTGIRSEFLLHRTKGGIMKKSRHNSGTSLFLMEMILALLFLSLSSAACIQIFAAARKSRLQAEQWNQIQALTTSVGEVLEGTDGTDEQILSLLPGGIKKDTRLIWYYNRNWQSCSSGEAACEMILETDISSSEKSGELSFRQLSNGSELYRITLRFPVDDYRREAVH